MAREEVAKIFEFASWERDKRVSFLEFFSANVLYKESITREQIMFVFDQMDQNNDKWGTG